MNSSGAFCPRCGEPVAAVAEDALAGDGTAGGDPAGDVTAEDDRASDASADPGSPAAADPTRAGATVPLCDACYFAQLELVDVPDRLRVQVCSRCGAIKRGEHWEDVGARDYEDLAIEALGDELAVHVDAREVRWGVEPEMVDDTTIDLHLHVAATVRDRPVDATVVVRVDVDRGTCDRCGRIAGEYFAGIVQLRAGGDRTPTDEEVRRTREIAEAVVTEMSETGDRNAFITEASESADGLDLKVSTNKIGQKIADRVVRELGGTVSDSETLVTEDEEGNELYRVTFAVRLPPYPPGTIIELRGDGDGVAGAGTRSEGPVLVRSARGNLKGVFLDTGERYEASHEAGIAPPARRLGTVEDAVETVVVTVEDEHAVQVLDPETQRATTIARPDYMEPDAERVPVLRSRAGLHVLPADVIDRGDGENEGVEGDR